MVLESIRNPKKAERHPKEMFFIGLLYATIAVFLSIWIFKEYSSLVMVFLTVTVTVPLMYKTMRYEEKKDVKIQKETYLLKEHGRAISFFVFMFVGFIIAYVLWYVFLPPNLVDIVFSVQTQTIESINAQISGNAATLTNTFVQIFLNNFKVLMFAIFFSFLYGAGAIFILTWNASVIAAAIGNFIRSNIAYSANAFGLTAVWNYFHVFSLALLRYFTHGIPEIAAYFIGGLAGGIISVAIIRKHFLDDRFKKIMMDALDLIVLAIFFLFIAALIEVFITPLMF